jgi:hypothetical protein
MSDILVDNKQIYNYELFFLTVISWITKITILLFIIGVFQTTPEIYLEFNFFVKLILGMFLIYRFNSYRKKKVEFTELDRRVCSSVGVYIVIISFMDIIDRYLEKIRGFLAPYISPLVNKVKNTLP